MRLIIRGSCDLRECEVLSESGYKLFIDGHIA